MPAKKGDKSGWLPPELTLEWRIFFGILCFMAVEEAVEHDQGGIVDLKKSVLVQ